MQAEHVKVKVEVNGSEEIFDVTDFAHSEDDNSCKFEVFKEGQFIASFEPDSHGFLNICRNPGNLSEETLYQIAEKIEGINY